MTGYEQIRDLKKNRAVLQVRIEASKDYFFEVGAEKNAR